VTALCAALTIGPCVSFCVHSISTVYSTHTGCSDSEIHFYCVETWNCVLQYVHSQRGLVAFHNSYVSADPLPSEFENSVRSH